MTFRQHSAFAGVSNCTCQSSHWFSVSSRKFTLNSQSVIRSTSTRLLICCVSVSSRCGCCSLSIDSQLNLPLPAICNWVSEVSSVQSSKWRLSWPHIYWQPLSTAHIFNGSETSEHSRLRTASTGSWITSHSDVSGLSIE